LARVNKAKDREDRTQCYWPFVFFLHYPRGHRLGPATPGDNPSSAKQKHQDVEKAIQNGAH
ncbi:unnamed protein product, partial [Prunus brigantina]